MGHRAAQCTQARKLSPERGKRLEALPGWSWDAVADQWEEGFQYLSAFVRQEGHARVPDKHHENGFRLGQWVRIQRSVHKQGKLSPERIERLEALPGWTWDPRSDRWEEGFLHLAAFVEREGHARVPRDHGEGGFRLGQSGDKPGRFKERGKLASQRETRLEVLPGWLWENASDREGDFLRKIAGSPGRANHASSDHARMPTQVITAHSDGA